MSGASGTLWRRPRCQILLVLHRWRAGDACGFQRSRGILAQHGWQGAAFVTAKTRQLRRLGQLREPARVNRLGRLRHACHGCGVAAALFFGVEPGLRVCERVIDSSFGTGK